MRRSREEEVREENNPCIKDLEKGRTRKEESNWERKRGELIERAGMEREQLRREMVAKDQEAAENFVKRIEKREREERRIKINESRYNRKYNNWERKRGELIERTGMEREQLRREMVAKDQEAAENFPGTDAGGEEQPTLEGGIKRIGDVDYAKGKRRT
ncbi:hypothetical protein EAG_13530 [Camponotus floridanus]|uniref:Uncharacterized protein n=1 Tax=Camponotus floridanus TaxID=104421 RepID=E2AUF0_CAMFO|nr:hypothetical protein EAG_13530 [Camponotus floridanus]